MHVPLLQRSHVFSQIVHGIEHHKLATILGVIAVLYLVYVLDIPVDLQISTQQSTASGTSASSSGIVRPLTLLDDPQYAHEYERRAQVILKHLDMLKNQTQADRAYAVSYSYDLARFVKIVKISKTFEIGQIRGLNPVSSYQGFSRMSWLYLKEYQNMISGLSPPDEFPQGYGTELYDRDGNAIGYLGIDYRQGLPISQVNEMTLLRQTAASITADLLQPLEYLNSQEEK